MCRKAEMVRPRLKPSGQVPLFDVVALREDRGGLEPTISIAVVSDKSALRGTSRMSPALRRKACRPPLTEFRTASLRKNTRSQCPECIATNNDVLQQTADITHLSEWARYQYWCFG